MGSGVRPLQGLGGALAWVGRRRAGPALQGGTPGFQERSNPEHRGLWACSHRTMVEAPYVETFAELLKACIERAEQEVERTAWIARPVDSTVP